MTTLELTLQPLRLIDMFDRKPVRINWEKYGEVKKGECTICKKALNGQENVCEVKRKPESLLDWNGNVLETLPAKTSAYLCEQCHTDIFQTPLTCQYCGILCKSTQFPLDKETEELDLKTGYKKKVRTYEPIWKVCKCACHKGVQDCTMLAAPSELKSTINKLKRQQRKIQ